jgi:thioredoxin-related protein
MSPVVNGLAQEYGDQMFFQQLNVQEEGAELFKQYRLRGHPAYVILDRRGKVAWQMAGQMSRQDLETALRRVLE